MGRMILIALACLALMPKVAAAQSVVTYHNAQSRSGLFAVPGLSLASVKDMHADGHFHGVVSGNVYAQPLYWQASGSKTGVLIVATESNLVYALNANTGAVVWKTQLPAPATSSLFDCGNIDPEGVTGTPVIDASTGTLYLDASVTTASNTPRQLIYALSLSNGKVLPKWPINVESQMNARHATFSSHTQGQRSALQFVDGKLYVTYAGRAGDCDSYYGTVIEFAPETQAITGTWSTRALGGGILSQGGITVSGASLFATTGNTFGADSWGDGEAVIRLKAGLARSKSTADYFAPGDWKSLDNSDADLGGTAAFPITVPTASGTAGRMIAMGKNGDLYILNESNLGGIGHPLGRFALSGQGIKTGPAVYTAKTDTLVAFTNSDGITAGCSGNNITMLKVTSSSSPVSVAWCAAFSGGGAPIITTTLDNANPVVWVAGAEGDNKLHGFDALTGKQVFESQLTMTGLHHFSSLIAANRHLYVAGDGVVYGFTF